MRLETAFLCDKATVRERLLHVLGAGITQLGRPQMPVTLALDLVILLKVETEEDLDRQYPLKAMITRTDSPDPAVASIDVEFGLGPGPLVPPEPFLPIVVPLQSVVLREVGMYEIVITIDGAERGRVDFRLTKDWLPGATPSLEAIPEAPLAP